jgi:hypothetical protein
MYKENMMKYLLIAAALPVAVLTIAWKSAQLQCVGYCDPPNEIITNRSFEEITVDPRIPDGWIGNDLTGSEGQDCTTAYLGSCSFLMQSHGANRARTLTQIIDHQGHATEIGFLRIAIKSDGKDQGYPAISTIYHHADGTTETFTTLGMGGFHDWEVYISSYTVSQDYVSIEVVLTFGGAEKIWFDAASLEWLPGTNPGGGTPVP